MYSKFLSKSNLSKGDIVQINKHKGTVSQVKPKSQFIDVKRINSSISSRGLCSTTDLDGNIYIIGSFVQDLFSNNISLSSTNTNNESLFIAQLGKDGEWKWARKIFDDDSSGTLNNFSIIFHKGYLYGAGVVNGNLNGTITNNFLTLNNTNTHNAFVIKFDQGGNIDYLTLFGGNLEEKIRLSTDGKGNVYFVNGYTDQLKLTDTIVLPDLMNPNNKQLNTVGYVAKLDQKGMFEWARDISLANDEDNFSSFSDIVTTKKGRSFIVGSFLGRVKLDDKVIKCRLKDHCYTESYSDSYTTYSSHNTYSDRTDSQINSDFLTEENEELIPKCFLLAEIDTCGNWVRERHFKRGEGSGIDMDSCGNLLITGFTFDKYEVGKCCHKFDQTLNLFISKLDKDWETEWIYSFPYTTQNEDNLTIVGELSANITLDEWDNIYVDSLFGTPLKINNKILIPKSAPDKFILKLNSDGYFQWVTQITGTRETYGKEVSVDSFGNVYAAVSFFNPLSVDGERVAYTYLETLGVIKIGQVFPKLIGVVTEIDDRCVDSLTCSAMSEEIIADEKVTVVFEGPADAFKCLKAGKCYYVDLEGCLTLDNGFRYLGTAISETTLFLQ